jgi:hypothetical protein
VLRADGVKWDKDLSTRDNTFRNHVVTLTTNARARQLPIAPEADGVGSSANSGELLRLALAAFPAGQCAAAAAQVVGGLECLPKHKGKKHED